MYQENMFTAITFLITLHVDSIMWSHWTPKDWAGRSTVESSQVTLQCIHSCLLLLLFKNTLKGKVISLRTGFVERNVPSFIVNGVQMLKFSSFLSPLFYFIFFSFWLDLISPAHPHLLVPKAHPKSNNLASFLFLKYFCDLRCQCRRPQFMYFHEEKYIILQA